MKLSEYVTQVINDPKYGHDIEWVKGNLSRAHIEQIEAVHDAEVRASAGPEIGVPCADAKPHPAHAWQMSATGWCLCAGVVAEEPEWEYGISTGWGRVDWRGSREYVEGTVKDFETAGAPLRDGQEVVRRRMAGPWVPVKQEGTE